MRIRSGWNSEPYGRRKFDIELGEEDLQRVLQSQDIDAASAPSLPHNVVYAILYCEAEILARAALVRHYQAEDRGDEAVRAVIGEITALRTEQETFLAPLRPKAKAKAKTG
jgi:hypothetical protein